MVALGRRLSGVAIRLRPEESFSFMLYPSTSPRTSHKLVKAEVR